MNNKLLIIAWKGRFFSPAEIKKKAVLSDLSGRERFCNNFDHANERLYNAHDRTT